MHMCNWVAVEGWQLPLKVFRTTYSKEGDGKGAFYDDTQLESYLKERRDL